MKIMLNRLFISIKSIVQLYRNRGGHKHLRLGFYSVSRFLFSICLVHYQFYPRPKSLIQLGFNKYVSLLPLRY